MKKRTRTGINPTAAEKFNKMILYITMSEKRRSKGLGDQRTNLAGGQGWKNLNQTQCRNNIPPECQQNSVG